MENHPQRNQYSEEQYSYVQEYERLECSIDGYSQRSHYSRHPYQGNHHSRRRSNYKSQEQYPGKLVYNRTYEDSDSSDSSDEENIPQSYTHRISAKMDKKDDLCEEEGPTSIYTEYFDDELTDYEDGYPDQTSRSLFKDRYPTLKDFEDAHGPLQHSNNKNFNTTKSLLRITARVALS